jgi:hypothetical protein
MSSHHFVKEGQEPAILIIDLIAHEVVAPLLEWAPLVIVYDRALDRVLDSGIKIDVAIVIDQRPEDLILTLKDQMPVEVLSCTPGEDPLKKCIQFLIASEQTALNIICDSPMAIMQAIDKYDAPINVSVLNATIRWSLIVSGEYIKWFPKNSKLQINGGTNVKIQFNSGAEAYATDSVINIPQDGLVYIGAQSRFWIGES